MVASGWPAVRDKCADLGISFDEWQHGTGRLILAKRDDGKYAATIGGTALSIPRQVGKTFLVGAIVFALCLLNPGLTVIWTAHRLRTAGETFDKMRGMASRKRVKPHILKIVLGSGEEEIRFHNRSRILFGARERGFGRGFDEVDVLIFDEAQILTENAIDDMVPATNQSKQPSGALMLFMGTPPKPTDPGEVFTRMRTEALSGEDRDTGYVEFSADPGFKPSESPTAMTDADWTQIAKANPSHPSRTPREAILRMRKKLKPDSMSREGYGIWDEADVHKQVIPSAPWKKQRAEANRAPQGQPDAFGLDMSRDRVVSIGVCVRDGERRHVEVAALDKVQDTGGVVEWLVERAGRRIPVYVDSESPATAMVPALRSRGVRVNVMSPQDSSKACGSLHDAIIEGRLTHFDQKPVNIALASVTKVAVGKAGGWRWNRDNEHVDISPLVAITAAWFGSTLKKSRTGRVVTA